jgi:hypothetical protein
VRLHQDLSLAYTPLQLNQHRRNFCCCENTLVKGFESSLPYYTAEMTDRPPCYSDHPLVLGPGPNTLQISGPDGLTFPQWLRPQLVFDELSTARAITHIMDVGFLSYSLVSPSFYFPPLSIVARLPTIISPRRTKVFTFNL